MKYPQLGLIFNNFKKNWYKINFMNYIYLFILILILLKQQFFIKITYEYVSLLSECVSLLSYKH
jgi:hypothetical protein